MLAFAIYSANVPGFIAEWDMSYTQAGWLGGIFSFGNLLGIPVLVTLTDRFDSRRIWLGSMALMGLAHLGFALFAEGLWSALLFRGLSGIGFAGTLIPGLRLLSEHTEGAGQARAVTFYSAGTGLGGATSFFMSGLVLGPYGWEGAYMVGAAGCAVALLLVLAFMPPSRRAAAGASGPLVNFGPVLRNRPALAYVLANMGHSFENYGARAWTVAFLMFAMGTLGLSGLPWGLSAPSLMAAIVLAGSFGGYFGGTLGERFGRRPVALAVVVASFVSAVLAGLSPALSPIWPFAVVFALHSVTMTMDNGVLNAGALATAQPELRGATMAVYGFFGFIGAMLGPTVFGIVLDIAGSDHVLGWAAAFTALGLVGLLGALGLLFVPEPQRS